MINKNKIERASAKIGIVCSAKNLQSGEKTQSESRAYRKLPLNELTRAHLKLGVSEIDEDNATRRLTLRWQILLVDSVRQSNSRGLVEEFQTAESSNLASIQQSMALSIIEPDWNTNNSAWNLQRV